MLQIKVNLHDTHEGKFLELQKYWSLSTYTETVRHLISTCWKQEIAQDSNYITLKTELVSQLSTLVKRKDIQDQYFASSVTDLVNKAAENLLEEIKKTRKSIFDWNFRKRISDEELLVTSVIAKVQNSRVTNDFTFDSILKELNWRNVDRLKNILNRFEEENLISSLIVDNSKVYHAPKP